MAACPAEPTPLESTRRDEAATHNRLVGKGVTGSTADAWIAAREARAAEDCLERGSAYWQAGWDWIAVQREHRVRPAHARPATKSMTSSS